MNIQINSFGAIHFFQESTLTSVSTQLKNILKIAAIAFICLAAGYMLFKCCNFIANKMDEEDDKALPGDLVIKADAMPQIAEDFIELGKTLPLDGKVEFPDGSEMTQEEVFLEAIKRDPENSDAYNYLGTIIDALSKVTLPDGTEMNQQELFLMALEKDHDNSAALCNLGSTLEGGGSMERPDGTQLTREQQFVRVIKKHNAVAHPSLTRIHVPGEPAEMTRREIYLKAIELDEDNSTALYNLSFTLKPRERITLPDGQDANIVVLLLLTLQLNPEHAEAYSDLANLISQRAPPLRIPNLPPLTKQGYYKESIKKEPHDGSVYYNLSQTLNFGDKVELPNGKKKTIKELLLTAININPYFYIYYRDLINQLDPNETVTLLDGSKMTVQQLSDKMDDCANKYGLEASPY